MRSYETTFIISGAVNDTERENIIARYEKLLTGKGAEMIRIVRWGKRQLAYEINKQTRGYYVIFYYTADPAIIRSFHHEMDINERILRYMSLKSDGKHPDYIRDEGEPSEGSADVASVDDSIETDDIDISDDLETDDEDLDEMSEDDADMYDNEEEDKETK